MGFHTYAFLCTIRLLQSFYRQAQVPVIQEQKTRWLPELYTVSSSCLSCRINNYYLVTRLLNQSTAALGPIDQNKRVNILKLQLSFLQQTLLLK
jgi:hypothetical protein